MGTELQYFDPDLYSTFIVGPVLFFTCENVLVPFVFQPFSMWFLGVQKVKLEKGTRLYSKVMEYFPHLMTKVIMNVVEFGLWLTWLARFDGWQDWRNWVQYTLPLPTTHEEYGPAKQIYYIYFVFIIFTTLKDIWRRPANTGIAQYSFDMHHLLALGLTGASLSTGMWRGGMLCRVSHGITDVVVYSVKIIETYDDVQGILGRKQNSYLTMAISLLLIWVAWVSQRVVVYGYICVQFTYLVYVLKESYPKHAPIAVALCIGSWLMYVLQWVWAIALSQTILTYIKQGKIVDKAHAHHQELENQATKKQD